MAQMSAARTLYGVVRGQQAFSFLPVVLVV